MRYTVGIDICNLSKGYVVMFEKSIMKEPKNKPKQRPNKKTTPTIAIYGLIRSGTNAIEEFIRLNVPGVAIEGRNYRPSGDGGRYWKHGEYSKIEGRHTHVIIAARNVWEWLPSAHRLLTVGDKHKHAVPKDFKKFLYDSSAVWKEHSNPVLKWNTMTSRLDADNGDCKKLIIRNEDLIDNPAAVLAEVCERFELPMPAKVKRLTKEAGPPQFCRNQSLDFTRGREIAERRCMKHYDDDDIQWVNSQIDWQLVHRLGYESYHETMPHKVEIS
jgi:hypothetical protein